MTGEDACPTTQNQRLTLDVGQASWPVDAFFSSLLERDTTLAGRGKYRPPRSVRGTSMSSEAEQTSQWERIVAEIADGQATGQETLYAVFERGVRFYLAVQLRAEDVDDKLHDTFLAVVKAIRAGQVRDAARLPFFIRTVAQRQVSGHITEPFRRRSEQLNVALEQTWADHRPDPEKDALSRERRQMAAKILRNLPEIDRQILIRFYLKGQAPEQICSDLRITQTQFRVRKSRAKERFAEMTRSAMERKKPAEILLRKEAPAGH